MSCWLAMALFATTHAAPLSYEEAQAAALEANPALRTAERSFERAGYDVRAANGSFDPTLNLNGQWGQQAGFARFPGLNDDVAFRSEVWTATAALDATAPTGTSARFAGVIQGFDQTFLLDNTGDAADEDPVARTFRPEFSVRLSQELLRGIRLATNLQSVRQANDGRTVAELRLEKVRQQTLKDVAEAYWTWVYQVRLSQIADEAVTIATEDLRIGTARVEAGEAAPVERTRLEAALVQARSSAIDAENGARQAADAVLLLLGREPGAEIEPTSEPGEVPLLSLEPDKVTEVALADSLDLRIARQEVETAQFNLADARHAALPTLTASLDAGLKGSDDRFADAFALNDTMFPTVGVEGNFSMPLGNRVATGRSRSAAVDVVEQRAALQELERQIRSQVEQQVRLMVSARQKVELADANLRFALETFSAEEALYDAGRSLLKDVLEARNEVDRARAEAAKARTDFRVAQAELLRLQGRLGVGQ